MGLLATWIASSTCLCYVLLATYYSAAGIVLAICYLLLTTYYVLREAACYIEFMLDLFSREADHLPSVLIATQA